jgi:hypothetical protein
MVHPRIEGAAARGQPSSPEMAGERHRQGWLGFIHYAPFPKNATETAIVD